MNKNLFYKYIHLNLFIVIENKIASFYFKILILLSIAGKSMAQDSIGMIPQEMNQEVIGQLSSLIRWNGVIYSIFLVIILAIALRFFHGAIDNFSNKFAQKRLLLQKIETFIQFITYILGAIVVFLLSFKVNDHVLAVMGGTVAVAVGFAVKDLVASFLAGIIIMLDRPFQVGDRVRFGGEYGDITAIGLRSVRMQSLTDDTITIPNNLFLSEISVSGNYGDLDMQISLPFYIGNDQDALRAKSIVVEAAASSRYIHLPKPIIVLVNQTLKDNYFFIKLTLKAYILDTQYEMPFETDVTLRVMEAFKKEGIQPPAVLHRNI
jgi:small-conductance mechanosensitive channel